MAVRGSIDTRGEQPGGDVSPHGEQRAWQTSRNRVLMITSLLGFGVLVVERNLALPIVINPDGVNYAILAEEYAVGNVRNAINGYWGPAISWLMAVPVALGADALVTFRVLAVGVLLACLVVVWSLARSAKFRPELRFLAVGVSGLMMLPWSLEVMTPDLLMLLVMLLLFSAFDKLGPELPRRRIVSLGLLGGVAFLVKPYGLPFFIVAFPVFLGYLALRYRSARSIRLLLDRYAIGMAAFLALALPWIAAISWKYGHFTIGTSGRINLTLVAPEAFRTAHARPVSSFNPPPFPGAVTGLEPLPPTTTNWNPLGGANDLRHVAGNALSNATELGRLFWPTLLVIGLAMLIAGVGVRIAGARVPELPVRALLFSAVYVGLYCLVLVEVRYLWPVIVVMLLGVLAMVNAWTPTRRWLSLIVAMPIAIVLVMGPYWRPGVGLGRENLELLFEPQAARRVMGAQAQDDAEALRPIAAGGRIASNGAMERTSYLAYFLDSSYYGAVAAGEPEDTTRSRLSDFGIDVFLLWGDPDEPTPDYLEDFTLRETRDGGELRVYTRPAAGSSQNMERIGSTS